MVTKIIDGGYKCDECGNIFKNKKFAEYCEASHDIIYVAFKREDLFKLMNYLINPDPSLLSKSLMDTLYKYTKGHY